MRGVVPVGEQYDAWKYRRKLADADPEDLGLSPRLDEDGDPDA